MRATAAGEGGLNAAAGRLAGVGAAGSVPRLVAEVRGQNIAGIAYNTRYLILPWVEVEHLASHLLGRMTRELSQAWQRVYGHAVSFAKTFVDPSRYRGICYRAANWRYLGQTQGRGKDELTHSANRTLKDILGLPLCADYRERLG